MDLLKNFLDKRGIEYSTNLRGILVITSKSKKKLSQVRTRLEKDGTSFNFDEKSGTIYVY